MAGRSTPARCGVVRRRRLARDGRAPCARDCCSASAHGSTAGALRGSAPCFCALSLQGACMTSADDRWAYVCEALRLCSCLTPRRRRLLFALPRLSRRRRFGEVSEVVPLGAHAWVFLLPLLCLGSVVRRPVLSRPAPGVPLGYRALSSPRLGRCRSDGARPWCTARIPLSPRVDSDDLGCGGM